jgi:hypothetical protein
MVMRLAAGSANDSRFRGVYRELFYFLPSRPAQPSVPVEKGFRLTDSTQPQATLRPIIFLLPESCPQRAIQIRSTNIKIYSIKYICTVINKYKWIHIFWSQVHKDLSYNLEKKYSPQMHVLLQDISN